MKNYAQIAWEWFKAKLPIMAGSAEPIARSIKIAIDANDVEGIRSRAKEAREFGNKWVAAADFLEVAVADNNMDLYEGCRALEMLNELIDAGEDIFTGVDEDATPNA